MPIEIAYEDTEILGLDPEFFVVWLSRVCKEEGFELGALSIICCSDDYLLDINNKYLNHDFYTDIITFDYNENGIVSGDIFVSIDRVSENAQNYGVAFNHELNRIIVHGVLHLCGYKDKSKEEKSRMTTKENNYLEYVPRET